MKISRIIFAAVFAGALLASCAPKEEQELISDLPETVAEAQPVFVSINASKTIDTKALAIVGTALKPTWEDGETVGVYKVGDSRTKYGTLSPATFGSNTTKLEGTIDVTGLSAGDQLFLLYPDSPWYYYGQDGTLATISSSYDFATATVAISSVDSDHLSAESASFSNRQAIVKFTLKEKGAGAISASGFTILSKNKKLVSSYNLLFEPDESDNLSVKLNPEAPVSELTLAVATSGGAADDYGFYASTMDAGFNETLYEFIKEGVTFENGKYYTVNLNNLEEVHYVAAGSPASVFGEEWIPTREANELDFNGSYFARAFDIPGPCQIEFKVVRNGTVYYPFPEGGADTNIKVAALGKGSINIVMNPITKEVSYDIWYETTPETSWTVAGATGGVYEGGKDDPVFGKTWDPFVVANDMAASGSKFVKTFSAVPAGTEMEFKVVKNRDWNGEVYGGDANANYYYKVLADGDVTITFDPAGPTITVDGPAAPADVYTVAGAPAAIFGTEWDAANTDNDLLKQPDGMYLKQYNVTSAPADPILFKILKDHVWGNAGENNWPNENYSYQIPKAGTLNIWFNPESKKVEAWMDDERYSIAGTFNGWDTAANYMTLQSDGTYKCVIPNLTAGDYEYKLVTGGTKWAEGDNSQYVLNSPCDLEFIYNPITGVFSFNELNVAP